VAVIEQILRSIDGVTFGLAEDIIADDLNSAAEIRISHPPTRLGSKAFSPLQGYGGRVRILRRCKWLTVSTRNTKNGR